MSYREYVKEIQKQEAIPGLNMIYERFRYDFVEGDIKKEEWHKLRILYYMQMKCILRTK